VAGPGKSRSGSDSRPTVGDPADSGAAQRRYGDGRGRTGVRGRHVGHIHRQNGGGSFADAAGTEPDHGAHPVRGSSLLAALPRTQRIRTIFFLMQLLITVFIFFSSLWLAMFLSKQITRPVEALGVAMDEIATGKYDHRVAEIASGEMGDLVRSFNTWRRILRRAGTWRELFSTADAANQAIEERRRELETIVETIPSGVVTLDGSGVCCRPIAHLRLLWVCGRRFADRGTNRHAASGGVCRRPGRLIRRGHRMGAASTEIEIRARGRTIHLAITSARLELMRGQTATCLWWKTRRSCCARSAIGVEGSGAARGS